MSPVSAAAPPAGDAQVSIFQNGRKTVLTAQVAGGLLQACEEQLNSADSVLRLAVSRTQINRLRQQGLAVEIEYPTAKTFQPTGKKAFEVRHLLIPLSGDLAGPVTTIFYGMTEYESGPFRNRKGSEELLKRVQEIGLGKQMDR